MRTIWHRRVEFRFLAGDCEEHEYTQLFQAQPYLAHSSSLAFGEANLVLKLAGGASMGKFNFKSI